MVVPHGGTLVDRTVAEEEHVRRTGDIESLPPIHLDEKQLKDVLNVANGRYSPLEGFMNRNDFLKVIRDETLEDGTIWPLPIIADIDDDTISRIEPNEKAVLVGPSGAHIGTIDVEEIYKFNKRDAARNVFRTEDPNHPGVAKYHSMDDFLVGGKVNVFEGCRYDSRDLLPKETRILFRERGWDRVVGFQTRNAPHRGHEYIQKCALEQSDGILIQPKLGDKKTGDYRDEIILGAYERLIEHYYRPNTVVLSTFPCGMRYAGPREAVFDAIVRKNHGCTHFIVGRDHAGVGDYYDAKAAHRIFETIGDLGIEPLLFEHAFYCTSCDGMVSRKICPHRDDERVYPSGSTIRDDIRGDMELSEKMIRPEVVDYLRETENTFIDRT